MTYCRRFCFIITNKKVITRATTNTINENIRYVVQWLRSKALFSTKYRTQSCYASHFDNIAGMLNTSIFVMHSENEVQFPINIIKIFCIWRTWSNLINEIQTVVALKRRQLQLLSVRQLSSAIKVITGYQNN